MVFGLLKFSTLFNTSFFLVSHQLRCRNAHFICWRQHRELNIKKARFLNGFHYTCRPTNIYYSQKNFMTSTEIGTTWKNIQRITDFLHTHKEKHIRICKRSTFFFLRFVPLIFLPCKIWSLHFLCCSSLYLYMPVCMCYCCTLQWILFQFLPTWPEISFTTQSLVGTVPTTSKIYTVNIQNTSAYERERENTHAEM